MYFNNHCLQKYLDKTPAVLQITFLSFCLKLCVGVEAPHLYIQAMCMHALEGVFTCMLVCPVKDKAMNARGGLLT